MSEQEFNRYLNGMGREHSHEFPHDRVVEVSFEDREIVVYNDSTGDEETISFASIIAFMHSQDSVNFGEF